jgi:hypothetical protein
MDLREEEQRTDELMNRLLEDSEVKHLLMMKLKELRVLA